MRAVLRAILVPLATAVLAACSSGQTATVPAVATPNVADSATLQFAVGTATIGIANGATALGLNVVATFRQPNGNNATGLNTPTLSAPAGVNFGPLLGNGNQVVGVTPAQLAVLAGQVNAQPSPPAAPPLATTVASGFGPFVGVFGYGLAGDNLVSNTDLQALLPLGGGNPVCLGIASAYVGATATGSGGAGSFYGAAPNIGVVGLNNTPLVPGNLVRSAELALPIPSGNPIAVCTCPSTCAPPSTTFGDAAFPVQYFGGPPAWPSPQGYGNFSYFVGYPLGFTEFTATPVAGTYSLSVLFPTSSNYATFGTVAKTAQLPARVIAAPLPAFPQPALQVNPDGSGTLSVNVPAGVREAVISVVTNDCDLTGRELAGGVSSNHYALVTRSAGPQTLFLSSLLGPPSAVTGLPTHTFCTLADVQAYNSIVTANQTPVFTSYPINSYVNAAGFDYPAYESSYPFDTTAAPKITNGDGHSGQADVTTSYPLSVQTTITVPPGS